MFAGYLANVLDVERRSQERDLFVAKLDGQIARQRLIIEAEAVHPSWSSRTIDGVGHLPPWESPELYVELAG